MGSEMALIAARVSATAGHVPPGLIPFLASPNTDIQHRLNWTLRFPLPDQLQMILMPIALLTERVGGAKVG